MKTWSQTKKRKLDIEETNIPQLNEDVLGVILKHVVRKHQIHARKIVNVIVDHHKPLKLEKDDQNLNLHHFAWPKSLKSNSQRLVHHAELKMLPNVTIKMVLFSFEEYISSNRELDLMWEAFKHIGYVHSFFNQFSPQFNGKMKPAEYFKMLRDYLHERGSFVEKLEAVQT